MAERIRSSRRLRDLSPTDLATVRGGSSSLPTESLSLNYQKIRAR
jgi:hypothetical protein